MTVITADRAVRTLTQEEIGVDCHDWQSGKQSCQLMMSRNGGFADAYQRQARNCKIELFYIWKQKKVFHTVTNLKGFSVDLNVEKKRFEFENFEVRKNVELFIFKLIRNSIENIRILNEKSSIE